MSSWSHTPAALVCEKTLKMRCLDSAKPQLLLRSQQRSSARPNWLTECFFVITAEASFAVKQHLYKSSVLMLSHQASNLYQLVSSCTNLYHFETQILEQPYPQSPREAQGIMKVMSADCVLMVTHTAAALVREQTSTTQFRKASTPTAARRNNIAHMRSVVWQKSSCTRIWPISA